MTYTEQTDLLDGTRAQTANIQEEAHAAAAAASARRGAEGDNVTMYTLAAYYAGQAAVSYGKAARGHSDRLRDRLNTYHAETLRAEAEPDDARAAQLAAANALESARTCADLAVYNCIAAEQATQVCAFFLALPHP